MIQFIQELDDVHLGAFPAAVAESKRPADNIVSANHLGLAPASMQRGSHIVRVPAVSPAGHRRADGSTFQMAVPPQGGLAPPGRPTAQAEQTLDATTGAVRVAVFNVSEPLLPTRTETEI